MGWGVTYIAQRYRKANIKYMKLYSEDKTPTYFI